ncbi:hypothetical protein WG954_03910 [Lacibacter sp. H375]|uniref:RipA family octameric membrane protein n=1 Tax=Lacibacter sp. H375 TaxID=3133424 RepID=UPI0030BCA97E
MNPKSASQEALDYKKKTEFENALKQRNFEIDLFWKRSWFFGALIIAEIAAYYKLKVDYNENFPPVTIAFLTCLTVLAQCLMNRGSKYWQERWEYMTMNREAALNLELTRLKKFDDETLNSWLYKHYKDDDRNEWFFIDASILAKDDNLLTKARRFSVSKITFLVWDIILIISVLCWFNESLGLLSSTPNWIFTIKLSIFYFIILAYIFLFWRNGSVYENYKQSIADLGKEKLKEVNSNYANGKISTTFPLQ